MNFEEFSNINQKRLSIAGVPGAGKTTFASNLAKHLYKEKILYLSFGRENTLNAMRALPNNVDAYSFHAFAKKQLNIASERIVNHYSMSHAQSSIQKMGESGCSPKILEAFCVLMETFVSSGAKLNEIHKLFLKSKSFPPLTLQDKQNIVRIFKRVWDSLWELGAKEPITHDMYLKAFAINPRPVKYSRILIDEKQDLNDAMISMTEMLGRANPYCQLISFGDPCQQIFGFRGASEQFISTRFDFKLDRTYRFGQKLCDLLNNYMFESNIRYYTPIYSETDHTQILPSPKNRELISLIKSGEKITFLARFNTSLWSLLKKLVVHNITYSMLGGSQAKELTFLRQLYNLKSGRKISQGPLSRITYGTYRHQAHQNNDTPAVLACKFVENMGDDADDLFNKMEKLYVSKEKAQILLSTIHQAKGMQFRSLVVSNDLPVQFNAEGELVPSKREDCHLVYTALSRAINKLYLPKPLYQYQISKAL